MTKKQKKMLWRIAISAVILIAANLVPAEGLLIWIRMALSLISYLVIGYDILTKAFKGILNGRVFDENFLMAVATIGAVALGIYEQKGDYNEAVAVMLFYQIGELFQGIAVGKSRKNITSLMDIRPDYANIEENGVLKKVDPSKIAVGSTIIVQPGEKIPLDGIVMSGNSSVNTSALTGESMPQEVSEGSNVISGCININGVLRIKTTKEFGESTVSKILNLALAILPPVIRLICGNSAQWQDWIYRALIFLVISCPCALVVSIPLSFFAGIGGAGKAGILIKGSNYLETLSKTKIVVFDKTGTLTQGVFEVQSVHHNSIDKEQLIEYAALAECASSHPISKSLQRAYGKEINRARVQDIEEISGCGITALVDGKKIAAGNERLMQKLSVGFTPCHSVGTIIHIAINGEYAGHIVISDIEKPNSAPALAALKKAGIDRTVMLTGDAKSVAQKVAADIGIDEVHSELLPDDKVTAVEELIKTKNEKAKLAFVGDGINDAPVLSRADIGIAMGAMGSDAAIEAADVVLMDDDPMKISLGIKISKKCLRIVYQNIVFSLVVKFAALLLGALGIANMWIAIVADVGVMVIAILNAIRCLKIPK